MHFNQAACDSCFFNIIRREFLGCCRCGKISCAGMCEKLGLFESVHALLALDSDLAFLLVEAKDRQNPLAQKLCDNLFGVALEHRLADVVTQQDISRIIVAPLRWGRILQGGWHPALFFKNRLKTFCQNRNIVLEIPQPVLRHRQARIAAEVREGQAEILASRRSEIKPLFGPNVLIIDDVLTSGKSSLELVCRQNAQAPAHPTRWHLFTLFRTPRPT